MENVSTPTCCNLCGDTRYYLVHHEKKKASKASPGGYAISENHLEKPEKIVRCMRCRLVYAIPREPVERLEEDYVAMDDPDYVREEKGRRQQARIILSKILRQKAMGKMLDVGCGPGLFLDEAKKMGWVVKGVDLSFWAVKHAKANFGIDVFQGTLTMAAFPDKSFDVVIMNDVIEHLTDPKSVLKEVRRIMKNDGAVFVSTPDIDSFWSRLLRARWWGINKYHLFYFSKKTLEKMFAECGLKSLRYTSYPRVFSWRYWVERLSAYPPPVSSLAKLLSGWFSADSLMTLDLRDQIGVVVKKIQRLELFENEISPERPPIRKMKVIAVLPAYNAEKTLERTVADIPKDLVNEIILVDDASTDGTVTIAEKLGLIVYRHARNRGYGANQKTCYQRALEHGAGVVVMCHPDYQYDPKTIPQLVEPILREEADAVFGSRMMKGGALEGGMPLWKHSANILLTAFENVILGTYLTEYHSGFRAYSMKALKRIRFGDNSDGFVFDTEIIVQLVLQRLKIEEIPIRTRYFEEASSIRLWPSILYGLGILRVMAQYSLHVNGWWKFKKFEPKTP